MKKQRIFLLSFTVITLMVISLIIVRPGGVSALNPGHDGCGTCHNLHASPGQSLTNQAVVETLCLSCHGPGGISAKKAEIHTDNAGSFSHTCTDCHNPHDCLENRFGGINLSQVGKKLDNSAYAKIDTPNSGQWYVVFESRGTDAGGASLYSFADNDEDGDGVKDGICEVCHTQTRFHRNNSFMPSHRVGMNCTTCHSHENGFLFSPGT
jgi:predicted CXXCH cytochrome family protein